VVHVVFALADTLQCSEACCICVAAENGMMLAVFVSKGNRMLCVCWLLWQPQSLGLLCWQREFAALQRDDAARRRSQMWCIRSP